MSYIVGQIVGILRTGSWSTVAEGKYIVTKVTKNKVTINRVTDGYARQFSLVTGRELGQHASTRTYLVNEDRYDQHKAMQQADAQRKEAIANLKGAVNNVGNYMTAEDVAKIRAMLNEAEKFVFAA